MDYPQIEARHRFCLWLIDVVTDGAAIVYHDPHPDMTDRHIVEAVDAERRNNPT